RERKAHLMSLSRAPTVVDAIVRLSDVLLKEPIGSAPHVDASRRLVPYLTNLVDAFGYANVYLFGLDRTLLFPLKTDLDVRSKLLTGPLKGSELAELFDRVRMVMQVELSDYEVYPGRSEPAGFIATPAFQEGRIVGYMAVELGNQQVFRVFNDYDGLGETGEA